MSAAKNLEPVSLCSTGRAAELLGVTRETIRRWIDDGYFPNSERVKPGGHWRVSRADIAALKARWKEKSNTNETNAT